MRPELGIYRLLQLLGEGLSSVVYKAIRVDSRRHSQQLVALKILKSEKDVQILKNEFVALLKVRSPFCVSVLGWENFQLGSALVLEYVHGTSLDVLGRFCQLPDHLLEEVIAQVQKGLMHLREFGLCHGDLSPANILIDENGCTKLVDFGLSNCPHRTRCGTPDFLAPERWQGAPPDFFSDLFAMGLICKKLGHQIDVSSLFEAQPERRQFLNLEPDPDRQRKLGELIKNYLKSQEQKRVVTQILSPEANRRLSGWVIGFFLAASLLIPRTPLGKISPVIRPASLQIHSQHWIKIEIDRKDLGFTPVQVTAAYPGKYHLHWRTQRRSGEMILRLEPGEQRSLSEKDFR